MFQAEIQTIRISTLEKRSGRTIEEWINDWVEEDDTVDFDSYVEPMTKSASKLSG